MFDYSYPFGLREGGTLFQPRFRSSVKMRGLVEHF